MSLALRHGRTTLSALLLITLVALLFFAADLRSANARVEPLPPVTPLETIGHLARTGVDAEMLAAAGLTAAQTNAMLEDAEADLFDRRVPLMSLRAEHAEAARSAEELKRSIQAGTAGDEAPAQYRALVTSRDQLQADFESQQRSLLVSAFVDLTSEQRAALETLRANRERSAPMEYRVVERSEEDWIALRDALANLRIASGRGRSPDSACQTLVNLCDAEAEVAAARSALQLRHAEVIDAMEAYVAGTE